MSTIFPVQNLLSTCLANLNRCSYWREIIPEFSSREREDETLEDKEVFTDKAILANMFIMLIARHETTGTALMIALTNLALNSAWQRRIQADLDEIFGDRPPSFWDLYTDVGKTLDGTLGATINDGKFA